MTSRSLFIVAYALAASLAAPSARAQAVDAAQILDACRMHAKRTLGKSGSQVRAVALDRDRHLLVERHSGRIGSQAIAWIASGRGALVLEEAPAIEIGFVCLLAGPTRALYFHWDPRRNGSSLVQCTRRGGPPEAARACLDALIAAEEMDLTRSAALRFQESREADTAAGDERAGDAYRKAAQAWHAYREAECARRAATARGVDAELARRACSVDLTRLRARDMQE